MASNERCAALLIKIMFGDPDSIEAEMFRGLYKPKMIKDQDVSGKYGRLDEVA